MTLLNTFFHWFLEFVQNDLSYSLNDGKEHEAGYDAYITGLSFLSMWKYLGKAFIIILLLFHTLRCYDRNNFLCLIIFLRVYLFWGKNKWDLNFFSFWFGCLLSFAILNVALSLMRINVLIIHFRYQRGNEEWENFF